MLPLNWYPELQPLHISALCNVQDVPVAAVPPEQAQTFSTQSMPLNRYPARQPTQIAASLVVQDVPAAAVPPLQVHELDVQAIPDKW